MVNFTIKKLNCENIIKVVEFLNNNFSLKDKNFFFFQEKFKSKIFQNPYQEGTVVCAETEEGKIIGTASLTPKKICINQREIIVAEIGDTYSFQAKNYIKKYGKQKYKLNDKLDNDIKFYADENFIRKSIFGSLVNYLLNDAKKKKINIIYGTANSQSLSSYINRFGFQKINSSQLIDYWLITPYIINQKFLFTKKINFFLNNLLFLFYFFYFKKINFNFNLNIQECLIIEDFKKEIDDLWEVSKKNYSLKKDFQYINWRFSSKEYKKFFLFDKKKIVTWIIIKKQEAFDYKKITICDFNFICSKKKFYWFFYSVLIKLNYQKYAVNFWSNTDNIFFEKKLLYKKKNINLIMHGNFQEIKNISNFTIGCSDNI
jgi:hypothetical protein